MYASERPSSAYGANRSRSYRQNHSQREPVPEETIRVEKLQVERKSFVLTLKENSRGRFLRITEDVNGRRDNIIIPTTGLAEFSDLVAAMADTAAATPEPGAGIGDD
jgi:hypothetical protein